MLLSLRQKIISVNLTLLLIVTIAAGLITTFEVQNFFEERVFEQLKTHMSETEFFISTLNLSDDITESEYKSLIAFADAASIRLTLIDSLGVVIFDSWVKKDSLRYLENHLTRPEVQMALHHQYGTNERLSATTGVRLLYAARAVTPKAFENAGHLAQSKFIRAAIPIIAIEEVLSEIRWTVFVGGAFALLIIAFVSLLLSKRLTDPIRKLARVAEEVKKGNLDAHFEHGSDSDINNLAELLDEMVTKLREDVNQMQKLQTMRSQFLGNVSHELRTPIFALQGYLETFLHSTDLDIDKQRTFVEKAFQNSVRLNNLLTDLIDISRIESGEMKMSFRKIMVHDWLEKIVSEYSVKDHKKGVTVHFANRDDKIECYVMGDKERLSQVVLNLVQNAINYNKEYGTVTVGYDALEDDVRIFVSDTGPGIGDEHLTRIFERFYRVDKERSRMVGGTGLGLAIVKHICEAHRTRVKVESKLGIGTTFSFLMKKK